MSTPNTSQQQPVPDSPSGTNTSVASPPPASLPWLRAVLLANRGDNLATMQTVHALDDPALYTAASHLQGQVARYLSSAIVASYTTMALAGLYISAWKRPDFRALRAYAGWIYALVADKTELAGDPALHRLLTRLVLRQLWNRDIILPIIASLPETEQALVERRVRLEDYGIAHRETLTYWMRPPWHHDASPAASPAATVSPGGGRKEGSDGLIAPRVTREEEVAGEEDA